MKKIMNLISLMFILVLVLSTFALAKDTATLKLSFINQDPDPARPGQYVDLKVRVDNVGDGLAEDVQIRFIDSFPFSLDQTTSDISSLGALGSNQGDDSGSVVEFSVIVASDAIEGNNKARFGVTTKGQSEQMYEFNVDVKTQDSGLNIKKVNADNLVQGKPGIVEIILENPSDSLIRDVTVSLDLSSDKLPFAPSDSATNKKIKTLKSGSDALFRFSLIPFPDADARVYKIPLTISYYDSTNQLVEKSDLIGVVVGSDADVSYYVEPNYFNLGDSSGVLTFNFINKGLIDVKFLDVIVEETSDYELISGKESYIGGVDSDDFETTDFKINKLNNNAEFNFVAKATFLDANNNEYSLDMVMPVKLFSGEEENSKGGWIIAIILVLIAGFGYKYFKKRSRK